MNRTRIEWAKNPDGTQGYTWNPITGCLNGCEYCYARKLANTRLKERYLANTIIAPCESEEEAFKCRHQYPFYPRFWEDKIGQPDGKRSPSGIFTCDMSDLFGIGIPFAWQNQVFTVIRRNPRHRFYLLTKQPQNLIKFSPFSDNTWVGVSVTNESQFVEAGYWLAGDKVKAKVKYLSIEPYLERIPYGEFPMYSCLDWVIIGSQTKPYKPPKVEWVREIVEACDKAGIPVFLKDNLRPILSQEYGKYPPVFAYSNGVLRQEMPDG